MGVDRLFTADSGESTWKPRPRRRCTLWLLGITVGVSVILALVKNSGPSAADTISTLRHDWLAVSGDGLTSGRIWQLLTYLFVHGDAMHLVWNMLLLFFVGTIFEDLFGGRALIGTYLICGAVAGLSCFIEGGRVLGASGALLAVLVVLAARIPHQYVHLFFFRLKMMWVAVIVVGLDVLMLISGGRGDTSHVTHLVGALSGFGYAFAWPRVMAPRITEITDRRRRRKEVAEMERDLEEERELDRILDKISREGMHTLSAEERTFLKRASQRLQDSRRP